MCAYVYKERKVWLRTDEKGLGGCVQMLFIVFDSERRKVGGTYHLTFIPINKMEQ